MSTIVMAVCLVMLAGGAAGVLYRLVKGPSPCLLYTSPNPRDS